MNVQEITEQLDKGIMDMMNSDSYRRYLATMSKFHTYSFNNKLLIAMQMPEATMVAGYRAWEKNFKRHVKRGEKAIRILAPCIRKKNADNDDEDDQVLTGFRSVSVFDVSQTEGEPTQSLELRKLAGDVDGYNCLLVSLIESSPVPIKFEDIEGSSNGFYDVLAKTICVREGMSQQQTVKTLVHEIAHAMLHSESEVTKDRETKELEAESVAYTVCQHFGIDSSEYSFCYIVGWAGSRSLDELRSSMERIQDTASSIITSVESTVLNDV